MPLSKIYYFGNKPLDELIVLIWGLFLIRSLATEVRTLNREPCGR